MKKVVQLILLSLIILMVFFACPSPNETTEKYTITFNKNDAEATGTMAPQVIAGGETENLTLCGFSKAVWAFIGWATTPTGSVEYIYGAEYTMGNSDVTLYAKWGNDVRTVTFDSQGGSAVIQQAVIHGSLAIEPDVPGWTAHALVGWFKDRAVLPGGIFRVIR